MAPENPYETPKSAAQPGVATNSLGRIGFTLALVGCAGLLVVGPFGRVIGTAGMCLAFLGLPGLVVSIAGVFCKPNHLAKWGIGIGLIVSLYLPTFYLSLFVFPQR